MHVTDSEWMNGRRIYAGRQVHNKEKGGMRRVSIWGRNLKERKRKWREKCFIVVHPLAHLLATSSSSYHFTLVEVTGGGWVGSGVRTNEWKRGHIIEYTWENRSLQQGQDVGWRKKGRRMNRMKEEIYVGAYVLSGLLSLTMGHEYATNWNEMRRTLRFDVN